MLRISLPRLLVATIALGPFACGRGDPALDHATHGDESPSVCDVRDMTQEGKLDATLAARAFAKLQDPVANLVLRSGSCPTSFGAVQRKITERAPGCKPDTIRSHLVSEAINQTGGAQTSFRV